MTVTNELIDSLLADYKKPEDLIGEKGLLKGTSINLPKFVPSSLTQAAQGRIIKRMQNSLFNLENRYASLSKTGDPLEQLNAVIDWEMFRSILECIDKKERKSQAGRKPGCRILMFKMLILQRLNGLSDERLHYQVTERLSFMRFWVLSLQATCPMRALYGPFANLSKNTNSQMPCLIV